LYDHRPEPLILSSGGDDLMNFHNAVSITEFLSSAVSMLRNARDLAKESGNAELKRVINELFDAFSEMKERMLAMDD
jgi:hypothetical protein